jgi:hypothetical protein
MAIVFACPNCGANQSVNDDEISTQCQFCGNTISVPENLRPKSAPPPAAPAAFPGMPSPQPFSMGGPANIPGMAGLPGMFMNMDLNKLRAMAMAARSGDKAEAARLYQENFGVSPEDAMQAAELMSQHHPLVLSQMQFGTPNVIQMGSQPVNVPVSAPTPIYNLPSPSGGNPRAGGGNRWGACIAAVVVLVFAMGLAGAIVISALARAR